MRRKILLILILTLGFVMPYMLGLSTKIKAEEIKIPKELPGDLTVALHVEDRGVATPLKDQPKEQGDLPEPPKKISKDTMPSPDGDTEGVKPEIEISTPEVSAPEVEIRELCST